MRTSQINYGFIAKIDVPAATLRRTGSLSYVFADNMRQEEIRSTVAFIEFLSRCIDGESDAWNSFMHDFHPLISGVAGRVSTLYSDDIVQEVYLLLVKDHFRLLRQFDGTNRPAFLVYLKRVTENAARNFIRKHCKQETELGEALEHLADERETPEATLLHQADLERLTEAIALLRKDYQNVINLLLKGYRHREVAEILDIPLKTSLTWAHRAVAELRKKLKAEINLHGEHILL
ncbi:MAG: hypothetical protein OHK0011_00030 [Turneriella sp.]